MNKVMYRFVVTASVAVLAASSAACARSGETSDSSSSSILSPSSLSNSNSPTLSAKGGGGGKPGGTTGGTGTLTLRMVTDANGNGLPNWKDQVTFDISTTATTQPFVDVACSQNGVLVYGSTGGFFDSYRWPWTKTFTLSSPSWQGGAASCTAKLYYLSGTSNVVLGSTSFTAYE